MSNPTKGHFLLHKLISFFHTTPPPALEAVGFACICLQHLFLFGIGHA
jgi:hypothetical protein